MNKQSLTLFGTAMALILGGALTLVYFRHHQKLGTPAVKTRPLPASQNLEVLLPEKVLNYQSAPIEVSEVETKTLPADTSFGKCSYIAPDGFYVQASVVLMGCDRTSLHKPEYCLQGQGWCIDRAAIIKTNILIQQPHPYDLPVVEMVALPDGKTEKGGRHAMYVYYYVADGELYAGTSGFGHMRRTAMDVLTTGTLPRWAYVSYFTTYAPGAEQSTFERIKEFITAATPQFQLYPDTAGTAMTARN